MTSNELMPKDQHEAIVALAYSIKGLNVAIEGINRSIERSDKIMESIRERYEKDIIGLQERMSTHSLRCIFAPEKDGAAQKTIDRVDRLESVVATVATLPSRIGEIETKSAKLEGALGLVKWMGFGTLAGIVGLVVKAAIG